MKTWDENLEDLRAFHAMHGHNPGYSNQTPLSYWVHTQRGRIKSGTLAPERARLLGAAPFFISNPEGRYAHRVKEIRAFVRRHKRLPTHNPNHPPAERTLGSWLHMERRKMRAGQVNAKHLRLLATIPGVVPVKCIDHEADWDANLERVRVFQTEHHRFPTRDEDHNLSLWVYRWRSEYRRGRMRADRIERAKTIPGFLIEESAWEVRWESNFSALEVFIRDEGRTPNARSASASEVTLANWIENTFKSKAAGSNIQRERLTALGVQPTPDRTPEYDAAWAARLAEVKKFIAENSRKPGRKRTNPDASAHENSLAIWLATARADHRAGRLNAHRHALAEQASRLF